MKNEFYYSSQDGNTEIHTIEWIPVGKVRGILQISHGMIEHIERYDEFARYLSARGFYVVGNDTLGHGKSVQSSHHLGFFGNQYSLSILMGDMQTLRKRSQKKYPHVPYFILGHSMGSTLLRNYIKRFGNGLAGVILTGVVAEPPPAVLALGRMITLSIGMTKGWYHRSRLLDMLFFGRFNRMMKRPLTRADWLTHDYAMLNNYIKDPYCSFRFTTNGYYHLLDFMKAAAQKKATAKIPLDLPMLIASGVADPVGEFGKGAVKMMGKYASLGMTKVEVKIYANMRHELLNEVERKQVYEDLYHWLEDKSDD